MGNSFPGLQHLVRVVNQVYVVVCQACCCSSSWQQPSSPSSSAFTCAGTRRWLRASLLFVSFTHVHQSLCSADNVPLPAYAAARRAAAQLLLTAAPPAVKQSIGIFWPPGSRQQTRSGRRMGETDRQKDTRHPAYYAGSARIQCTGHAAGRALDCPVSIPDCFAVIQRP